MVWHSTLSIETVDDWMGFSAQLFQSPEQLHEKARALMDAALERVRRLAGAGCELIIAPSDIAWNHGTFLSPEQMDEFVFPYLEELCQVVRGEGLPLIFHSDGDLRHVLDRIMDLGLDALQSIDPIAGMDLGEIKERTRGRLALMGNVDCGALHAGPPERVEATAREALDLGAPGGGYVYSSSNTIFQGVPLEHYEIMLRVYRERYSLEG
jgi:uroporphyrinogen decarboxylase